MLFNTIAPGLISFSFSSAQNVSIHFFCPALVILHTAILTKKIVTFREHTLKV